MYAGDAEPGPETAKSSPLDHPSLGLRVKGFANLNLEAKVPNLGVYTSVKTSREPSTPADSAIPQALECYGSLQAPNPEPKPTTLNTT